MANKNNSRSMRFSDEIIELIDRQVGDTFTQKFENLVTRCVWELPAKEKELDKIKESIDRERKKLMNLQDATREITQFEYRLSQAKDAFERIEASAKRIAEKCNTD